MKWLRLYSEARTDAKLRALSDAQHRVWFNLLCFAGEQSTRGVIDSDRFTLAVECAGADEQLLTETLALLARLRVVTLTSRDVTRSHAAVTDENAQPTRVTFVSWEKRQYDKPSDRPESTSERKRRSRKEPSSTPKTTSGTPPSRDVTPRHAIDTDTDTDTDTEADPEKNDDARTSATAAPSVVEHPFALLEALCDEVGEDVSVLSKSDKNKQLAVAKRLRDDGLCAEDVHRMVRWLHSQGWVTGGIDLFMVEKQKTKWLLAGRPDQAPAAHSRASPLRSRQEQSQDNVRRFLAQAGQAT